jgi:hypothetical protein
MHTYIWQIVIDMRKHYSSIKFCTAIFKIPGWMGVNEKLHDVCMITTLPLNDIFKKDAILASLGMQQDVLCD